jgi:hypothetical protein
VSNPPRPATRPATGVEDREALRDLTTPGDKDNRSRQDWQVNAGHLFVDLAQRAGSSLTRILEASSANIDDSCRLYYRCRLEAGSGSCLFPRKKRNKQPPSFCSNLSVEFFIVNTVIGDDKKGWGCFFAKQTTSLEDGRWTMDNGWNNTLRVGCHRKNPR